MVWMAVTGGRFVNLFIFDMRNHFYLQSFHNEVLIGTILITLCQAILIIMAYYIIIKFPPNKCVVAYGILIFFIGFCPLVGQGTFLYEL